MSTDRAGPVGAPSSRFSRPDEEGAPLARLPLAPIAAVAAFIALVIALAKASSRLTDIVGLVLAAAVLAWLVHPLHARVARRVGTAVATAAIVVLALLVAFGIGGLLIRDLTSGVEALSSRVHTSLGGGSGSSLGDRLQRSLRLDDGVAQWMSTLPRRLVFDADAATAVGQRILDLLVTVVLAAFILAAGRTIVSSMVALWPREERADVWALLADVDDRAGGFLRRVFTTGLVAGCVIAAVGWAVGMPLPVAVGLWAGFWLTVPTLGVVVGLAPVVAFSWQLDPLHAAAVIGAAIAVAVTVVALRRRISASERLRPGIGVSVLCLAVGVAMSGTAAAMLLFVVGAVAVAVATSEQRSVRLPAPRVAEAGVYRVGPIWVPRGIRGVVFSSVAVVLAVIAWSVLVRAASAIVWVTIAGLLAVAIDRPVAAMARRFRIPRPLGLAITLCALGAAVAALVATVVNQGPSSTARALERLPNVVRDLEDTPLIGAWLRDHHAATTLGTQLDRLPGRLANSQGALSWFPSFGSQLVDVAWVVVLTAALTLDGRRLVAAAERRVPARHRRQFQRLTTVSYTALAGYAAGSVLVCAINGVVVLILALALGVGLAPVLALWAFLWDFVPQVGGFIGGVPLIVFSLVGGPTAFLVATGVYVVYQLIETNLLFPWIIGDSVEIPGWATMVAALVGAAAGGVLGAVVLTPLVGVVRVIVHEYRRDDFPGRTAASVDPVPVDAPLVEAFEAVPH